MRRKPTSRRPRTFPAPSPGRGKNRPRHKKRNALDAWLHRWGISRRALCVAILALLCLSGSALWLAAKTFRNTPAQPPLPPASPAAALQEVRGAVSPLPPAPAPHSPSPLSGFEESRSDRLEDAVKKVDELLLTGLDDAQTPYSIRTNDVEWRNEGDEHYHFQRLLILFEGDDEAKKATQSRLRAFLEQRADAGGHAVAVRPLTDSRTHILIDGRLTHELLFASTLSGGEQAGEGTDEARLAILIDDIGESRGMLRKFLDLGIPMAFAVLPHTAHARECAADIAGAGHELLLHHPMEPLGYPAVKPGPGAVYARDSGARISEMLADNLVRVPGVQGLNNHMGSRFTSTPQAVDRFLDALGERKLFLVDSLTTPGSKFFDAAKKRGFTAYRRDVFLDDVAKAASIRHELDKAAALARKQGHALVIGHPRAETLAVLEEWLKTNADGLTFCRIQDLRH